MKRFLLSAVALIALIFSAGCNSPQQAAVTGLAIELASIERTSDGTANVTIRILNPNVVAYNVARAKHRVHLDGKMVGTVEIDRPTGVPARTDVAQQTGVLKPSGGGSLPTGETSYRLESELVLRLWGDNTQDLKVTASGTVSVK